MHIHGNSYWVLAAGNGDVLGADGALDPRKVRLNTANPPLRDNVAVPQAVDAPPSPPTAGSRRMLGGGMSAMGAAPAPAPAPATRQNGYTIVRLRADNSGVWSWHCHIDLHAVAGMFFYLTVREPASAAGAPWYAPPNLECTV